METSELEDLEDWRKSEPSTSFKEFLNKLVKEFKREKLVDLLEENGPESTLIRIIIYHILSYHQLLPTVRKTIQEKSPILLEKFRRMENVKT